MLNIIIQSFHIHETLVFAPQGKICIRFFNEVRTPPPLLLILLKQGVFFFHGYGLMGKDGEIAYCFKEIISKPSKIKGKWLKSMRKPQNFRLRRANDSKKLPSGGDIFVANFL